MISWAFWRSWHSCLYVSRWIPLLATRKSLIRLHVIPRCSRSQTQVTWYPYRLTQTVAVAMQGKAICRLRSWTSGQLFAKLSWRSFCNNVVMLKSGVWHLYLAVHALSALLRSKVTLSFLVCGRDITVLGVLPHRGPCAYVSSPGGGALSFAS